MWLWGAHGGDLSLLLCAWSRPVVPALLTSTWVLVPISKVGHALVLRLRCPAHSITSDRCESAELSGALHIPYNTHTLTHRPRRPPPPPPPSWARAAAMHCKFERCNKQTTAIRRELQ